MKTKRVTLAKSPSNGGNGGHRAWTGQLLLIGKTSSGGIGTRIHDHWPTVNSAWQGDLGYKLSRIIIKETRET